MSTVVGVESEQGRYVAKFLPATVPNHAARLHAEAEGLTLLARADHALTLPAVLSSAESEAGALLLLSWLDSARATADNATTLGRGLAQLHRHCAAHHGLDHDNFIGPTPQSNMPHEDWATFFAEQRLAAIGQRLQAAGKLSRGRGDALQRVVDRAPQMLSHDPVPSLLHGDLWGGNWLPLDQGGAALIDPAVYFGDRESDLAMSRLFGGFPPAFYHAYEAEWPLPAGAAQREALYNLYHLLNHLLLFGEGYGPQVDRTMAQLSGGRIL